jgi:hypothetical protein
MQEEEVTLEIGADTGTDRKVQVTAEIHYDSTTEPALPSEFIREESCSENAGENVDAINECSPEGPINEDSDCPDQVDLCVTNGEIELEDSMSSYEQQVNIKIAADGVTNDTCIDETMARLEVHAGLDAPIVVFELESQHEHGGFEPEGQKGPLCSIVVLVIGILGLAVSVAVFTVALIYMKDQYTGWLDGGEIMFWCGVCGLVPALAMIIVGTVCYCKIRKAMQGTGDFDWQDSVVESSTRPTLDISVPVKGLTPMNR